MRRARYILRAGAQYLGLLLPRRFVDARMVDGGVRGGLCGERHGAGPGHGSGVEGRRQRPGLLAQASDGKTYKLSEFKGKKAVVVAWFPKAFTQGCTIECKSLAENGEKIRMYDVAYFMASMDTLEENTKFAKATSVTLQGRDGGPSTVVDKKEADFPLLADPNKEAAASTAC